MPASENSTPLRDDILIRTPADRPLKLNVHGLACGEAGQSSSGPRGIRVAEIECLELQASILALIGGVLRAAWRLKLWEGDKDSFEESGLKARPERHWHHILGFAPYVTWRFMDPKNPEVSQACSDFENKEALWVRIFEVCDHYSRVGARSGDDLEKLLMILDNKIKSAVKLAFLCSLDIGWEGGECKTLHDGEGAPDRHWLSGDVGLSSQVVVALFIARFLTLQEPRRESKVLEAVSNALGQLASQCWGCAKTGKPTDIVALSKSTLSKSTVFEEMEDGTSYHPKTVAHVLVGAFESIEKLASCPCLLTSTESCGDGRHACWESDWSELYNRTGRQVLLESIGVLSFVFKFMADLPPPPGMMAIYKSAKSPVKSAALVLLGKADHAVYAVTKARTSLVATLNIPGHADEGALQGQLPDEPNVRQSGFGYLLRECVRFRPEGTIEPEEPTGIQLVSVLNMHMFKTLIAGRQAIQDEYDCGTAMLHAAAEHLSDAGLLRLDDMVKWPEPPHLVEELLRRIVFCFEMPISLDVMAIEDALKNGSDGNPLKSVLRDLAITAAKQTKKEIAAGGRGWREVLALTLEAIGWYIFHAEDNDVDAHNWSSGGRGHSSSIVLLEELLSVRCEVVRAAMDSTGGGYSWAGNQEQDSRDAEFVGSLLYIIEYEQNMSSIDGSPVSNALLGMMERIFNGFRFHALQQAHDASDRTNLGVALGKIENLWLHPDKQERKEWTFK